MRGSVAVVEDDDLLRRNLERGLSGEGFHVSWCAATAAEAVRAAEQQTADVLVLDLGLPDADGVDLIAALQSRGLAVPTLALTARSSSREVLQGFAAGVDDYLTKPFVFAELIARLDALCRRPPRPLVSRGLVLDPLSHALVWGGRSCSLPPTEFRLMSMLLTLRDRVVRRGSLKVAGWPPGAIVSDNSLDSYLARLRAHLGRLDCGWEIHTVRGVGYRMQQCG